MGKGQDRCTGSFLSISSPCTSPELPRSGSFKGPALSQPWVPQFLAASAHRVTELYQAGEQVSELAMKERTWLSRPGKVGRCWARFTLKAPVMSASRCKGSQILKTPDSKEKDHFPLRMGRDTSSVEQSWLTSAPLLPGMFLGEDYLWNRAMGPHSTGVQ